MRPGRVVEALQEQPSKTHTSLSSTNLLSATIHDLIVYPHSGNSAAHFAILAADASVDPYIVNDL